MTTKTEKTWKRGRRPKPREEKQSVGILTYLTPGEARELRADAAGLDMTPSAFLAGLWREWRESRED
jgi:hypothetical protein